MLMSLASSQQSFITNALSLSNQIKTKPNVPIKHTKIFSSQQDIKDSTEKRENGLAKLAIVTLAAGVLTFGSVLDASAAKTGGRVGGQAFRSPAPRSAPRINNNNSRTNIYIQPPIAPPLGGYGYGYGSPFFGGWGWSPFSFFAPSPGVVVGVGGGFDSFAFFLFLGAAAAVVRRFRRSRRDDDDEDY